MRKFLATSLAAIMLLALVGGCSSSPTPTPIVAVTQQPVATDSPTPTLEPPPTAAPLPPKDPALMGWQSTYDNHGLPRDPITITCNIVTSSLRHEGPLTNLSAKMLANATGITVNFIGTDQQKFAVLAAGNDLPDIITMDTTNEQQQIVGDLIKSGKLVNMEPLLSQYGTNLNALYGGLTYNWVKYWTQQNAGMDGIYFLPCGVVNVGDAKILTQQGSGSGFFSRLDVYEAVGSPAITDANGFNEDLLLAALKKMQDYARNEMGNKNAYALGGFSEWGISFVVDWLYQYGISGVDPNKYYSTLTNEYTGPFYEKTHPRWNCYRFFNKASQMGLFDPESFTMPFATFIDKIDNSQMLTGCFSWMFDYAHPPFTEKYPQVGGYTLKGMPFLDGVQMQNSALGNQIVGARAISAKSKYADRIMALFDYTISDEYLRDSDKCNMQGVGWEYNAQKQPVLIGDQLAAYNGDAAAKALFGPDLKYDYGMYNQIEGVTEKICADGFPADFKLAPYFLSNYLAVTKSMQYLFDYYKVGSDVKFPGQLYQQWIDQGIAKTNPPTTYDFAFAPAAPADLQQISTSIQNYMNDNESKLVFAKTDAEFNSILDSICSTIKSMGEDQVYQDAVARYDASKKVAAELTK